MPGRKAHVFTDHRNLLFVFAPLALEPALGRHVVSKVQRWALFLSKYTYVIEHIDGDDNVFADILDSPLPQWYLRQSLTPYERPGPNHRVSTTEQVAG